MLKSVAGVASAIPSALRDLVHPRSWLLLFKGLASVDGALLAALVAAAWWSGQQLAASRGLKGLLGPVAVGLLLALACTPSAVRLFSLAAARTVASRHVQLYERNQPGLLRVLADILPPALILLVVSIVAALFLRALGALVVLPLAVVLMNRLLFRLASYLYLTSEEASALMDKQRWQGRRISDAPRDAGFAATACILLANGLFAILLDWLAGLGAVPRGLGGALLAVSMLVSAMFNSLLVANFYVPQLTRLFDAHDDDANAQAVAAPSMQTTAPVSIAQEPQPARVEAAPARRISRSQAFRNCPISILLVSVVLVLWGAVFIAQVLEAVQRLQDPVPAEPRELLGLAWPLLFVAAGLLMPFGFGWARLLYAAGACLNLLMIYDTLGWVPAAQLLVHALLAFFLLRPAAWRYFRAPVPNRA
jgi:hypothetical protein